MAIKLPSHLHRSRSGSLHFRIAIPPDLRHHFASREIYRSLGTYNITEATQAAQNLSIAFKRVFREIRHQTMSEEKKRPTHAIDPAKLRELTLLTRQRLKHEDKVDALDARVVEAERRLRAAQQQHARELALVLDAARSALATSPSAGAALSIPATRTPSSPPFSEVVADYTRMKRAQGKWTEKTEDDYAAVYKLFIRIVGDKPINEIDDSVILTYLETLQKLPANMNKSPVFMGKTIEEILKLTPTPMAARSVNKNVERVSSIFKWALSKTKYNITRNPAAGMSVSENSASKRQPFTVPELITLFSSSEFKDRRFEHPYGYWLIPMGLLTGARLGELCQLYLSDFVEHNGVQCIDISDEEEGQRLKNRSAKRLVPIHDKLIELGLLEYVTSMRAKGEERLFPELNAGRDGFAGAASNWFQRYKKRCGIKEKHTKVFHSLRHTFISTLLDNDVPEHAVAQIVGHEAQYVTGRVYWNARDASKRKPTVDKFQLPQEVWETVPRFTEVTTRA